VATSGESATFVGGHGTETRSEKNSVKVLILGTGAWGRGVGTLMQGNGHAVAWARHTGEGWQPEQADWVVLALPVQHVRATLQRLAPPSCPVLNLSKGLEITTGRRVSEVIANVWGARPIATLSGPTLAGEVAQGLPAVAVMAAEDDALAEASQRLLHQPVFRVYRSRDVIGVEYGGALKNVYAIAGGVCVGLQLGENALAGLLTRSLAEMKRLGMQAGGQAETFAGLSGVGDLLLTAASRQSRNFQVGLRVAERKPREEILASLSGVAEGVATAQALYQHPMFAATEKPVATEVYRMLYEAKAPGEAVRDLMQRAMIAES
jgi:glycerol-3-phosphate dehydrogenase (NAD(P)+)